MTDSFPDWHKLIMAWISKGHDGLTIPFVVGARAMRTGANTAKKADIQTLFNEIIENPVHGNIVYARWCEDIGAIVMASYSKDFPFRPRHDVIEFKPSNSTDPSLVVEKSVAMQLGAIMNHDEILSALIVYAQPQVEVGHFSRFWTIDGRTHAPFQEEDLEFIQKTLEDKVSSQASPLP